MNRRLALAVLPPFLALALQWLLWPWIAPFVWFFFIAPQLSWAMSHPANLYSVGLLLAMGYLFSDSREHLRRAQRNTEAALTETRGANEKIIRLYRQTLELDERKTQFFTNASHEPRPPLTLIISPLPRSVLVSDHEPPPK